MSASPATENPLARVVGLPAAVFMGLGSILGTGVFVSLGVAAGVVGEGLVLTVALAALVATANGLSSAQLAAAHPVSGGTYEYGRRFLNPAAGFAAGFMFLAAKSASAATAALGCAGYLLRVLGLGGSDSLRVGLALALVLLVAALVAGGITRSSRANVAIVGLTLLALLAFVGGALHAAGAGTLVAQVDGRAWRSALASPSALLHGTALVFVAYTGYGRIATLGEEVRDPAKTIPRAIIVTLLVSMALYLAVALAAVGSVGAAPFAAAARDTAAPLEAVARGLSLPGVAAFVALGAVSAMLGVLLNLLLGLSRVLLAMARRGDMPAPLAHVAAGSQSPKRAVWAMGAFVSLLVLLGDVRTTWTFSAFSVLVYYGITNLAALRLPAEVRRYPRVVPAAGLLSCATLAAFVPWQVALVGVGLLSVGFCVRAALTNTPLDQGTREQVDFGTPSAEHRAARGTSVTTAPAIKILVADDDPELLNLISSHARSIEGSTVVEASDGEEALRLARSERPALVLLDVMMPGMSGWEVCRAIREEEGLSEAKVIMLTGIGERLNEMTSPLYGADAYLDKPFDLDDLSDRIEELVGCRPRG
jgi:APA family basic amino acid/polyamine antiporter